MVLVWWVGLFVLIRWFIGLVCWVAGGCLCLFGVFVCSLVCDCVCCWFLSLLVVFALTLC